jgi:predicted transcriptional regulator
MPLSPATIARRAKAIRLTRKYLAHSAGVHEVAVGKILDGDQDPRNSTVEKLSDALEQEEKRTLAHLLPLYPCFLQDTEVKQFIERLGVKDAADT